MLRASAVDRWIQQLAQTAKKAFGTISLAVAKEVHLSKTVMWQRCLLIFGSWERISSSRVPTQDSTFPGREVRLWISSSSRVSEINTHLKIVQLLYAGTPFSTCGLQASLQGRSLVEDCYKGHTKSDWRKGSWCLRSTTAWIREIVVRNAHLMAIF